MDNEAIIDLLFEIRDSELYNFKDENLKKLDKNISLTREKLEEYIRKRVNPKSREQLNIRIDDLKSAVTDCYIEKEKLYYQAGFSDCISLIFSAISFK